MDKRIKRIAAENISVEQPVQENGNRLEIFTLGRFLVRRGKHSFTEDAGKSHRLWKLFKFLLTYCERATHPELLIEALYPEGELKNPDRTLRNLIYRLRRLLANGEPLSGGREYIVSSQGLYSFNLSSDYWLDVEVFRELCSRAGRAAREDPGRAIVLYQKALSLYRGEYLPENIYDDWVINMRDFYHRNYLEGVYGLIVLLKKAGRYAELKKECETAFLIDPLQEGLHIYFMEVLLEEGKTDLAKTHYNYASSLLYREAGLKPSVEMRELYKKITGEREPQGKNHLPEKRLNLEREPGGAFFCNQETFFDFFRLEGLRAERSEGLVFWGNLTLVQKGNNRQTAVSMDEAMGLLGEVLKSNLRRGDIICRWNNNQFYLILSCSKHEDTRKILGRIRDSFLGSNTFGEVVLQCSSGLLTTGGGILQNTATNC